MLVRGKGPGMMGGMQQNALSNGTIDQSPAGHSGHGAPTQQ